MVLQHASEQRLAGSETKSSAKELQAVTVWISRAAAAQQKWTLRFRKAMMALKCRRKAVSLLPVDVSNCSGRVIKIMFLSPSELLMLSPQIDAYQSSKY